MQFDYVNPQEGIVLQILHDGHRVEPRVSGSIKGVRRGVKSRGVIADVLSQYSWSHWFAGALADAMVALSAFLLFGVDRASLRVLLPIPFNLGTVFIEWLPVLLYLPRLVLDFRRFRVLSGGPPQPLSAIARYWFVARGMSL